MKIEKPVVLASQSPRRRQLLRQVGLSFRVHASDVDETVAADLKPGPMVEAIALRKASAVLPLYPGHIVIGADTVVMLDGEVLNKPADSDGAAGMLRRLSGKTHVVYTGIAVLSSQPETTVTEHAATAVTFSELSEDEIDAYVATGSPLDKAGAYGIQDDLGAVFIARIDGDYYNVVGLPLNCLYSILKENFGAAL